MVEQRCIFEFLHSGSLAYGEPLSGVLSMFECPNVGQMRSLRDSAVEAELL